MRQSSENSDREGSLYSRHISSLLITEPCDCPRGVLWSSLPESVRACLRGCLHAVCVSQHVKYTGIGSGVCICTWTFLYLTFLQANNVRCKNDSLTGVTNAVCMCHLGPRLTLEIDLNKTILFKSVPPYCIAMNIVNSLSSKLPQGFSKFDTVGASFRQSRDSCLFTYISETRLQREAYLFKFCVTIKSMLN